jgi:hypothetical protein
MYAGANVPHAPRCALGAVQAAPHGAGPSPHGIFARYPARTRGLHGAPSLPLPLCKSLRAPPRGQADSKVVMQVGMGLSGTGCKWELKARTRRRVHMPNATSM